MSLIFYLNEAFAIVVYLCVDIEIHNKFRALRFNISTLCAGAIKQWNTDSSEYQKRKKLLVEYVYEGGLPPYKVDDAGL